MFHPNILSFSFRFHFKSQFDSISFSISVFRDFIFWKLLSCSFNDFSANLDPNSVIFYPMDLSSSLFSETIKILNFYPHLITCNLDMIKHDY